MSQGTISKPPKHGNADVQHFHDDMYRVVSGIGIGIVDAYLDADQSVDSATWTKVLYDTENYDVSNWFKTSDSTYNPKRRGFYRITAAVKHAQSALDKTSRIAIYKNNAVEKILDYKQISTSVNAPSVQGSAIVHNDGNDAFDIRYYQDSGGSRALSSTASTTYFQAEFIGGKGA